MRIGIVTHYWLPHRGGVEVMASEQAHRLAQKGHAIRVVSSAIEAAAGEQEHDAGGGTVCVERHPAWDGLGRRGIPWPVPSRRLVSAWRRLARWAEVVIVHGCTYAHSPAMVASARRAKTPVVLIQSNPHVQYPLALDLLQRVADRTVGRWCCHNADHVLSISRHTAQHVRRIAPRSPGNDVLYPGVDEHRWRPPTSGEKEESRRRLGLHGPVVLTVRRLVARNGVDVAIEAWRQADLDAVATLVVVGDGPQRSRLEALGAKHAVRFLGAADDATVSTAYWAADVFVLPTRSGEGFGLAAAQAMAVGLPVVTTTGGAQEEIVTDSVTGTVVPLGDVAALGKAIRRHVSDPQWRERTGAEARRVIEERFTWARSLDDLERVLLRVTSRGSA